MGAHEDDGNEVYASHRLGDGRGTGEDISVSVKTTASAGTATIMRDDSTVFGGSEGGAVRGDRSVFRLARRYIKPGWSFRITTALYSERKLLVFILVHFVATMVIWGHFALTKYQEQEGKVPPEANRYWWKRMAPTLEFGAMHAILFQMALLPLTVSRLSIAVASSSVFDRFIPFNRVMRLHIHLGYTMVSIVVLATIIFFAFFGLLCSDGEQEFCDKFTSEIMITGYCIVGFLLIIGTTSFLRNKLRYEIFYAIHHLVFILYIITIIHTFDVVQRTNERERSQTFKWFTAFVMYYVCDRAAMHINHRYQTSIAASSAVTSGRGTRMAIIKVHRPVLFHFKPGQYCLLRVPSIDKHWHPFSIASGPDSDYLEFYIEVYGPKSWTNRLWELLGMQTNSSAQCEFDSRLSYSNKSIPIEVKGPYGTSLGRTEDFSHAIAIGGGTGIVPILSMIKHHVHHLLRLDPTTCFAEQELLDKKIRYVSSSCGYGEKSICHLKCCKRDEVMSAAPQMPKQPKLMMGDLRSGDDAQNQRRVSKLASSIRDLQEYMTDNERKLTLKDIRRESRMARLPIFGSVTLLLVPVLGVTIIGLTLSWNTILIDLYPWMIETLKIATIVFQSIFAFVTLFVHNRSEFLTYIDVVISIVSIFADWYWFATDRWCNMDSGDLVYFSLLLGYMTLRTWYNAVRARTWSWRSKVGTKLTSNNVDKLTFVWITRSAPLVSKIVPDVIHIWNSLANAWGEQAANKVCNISIYITDKDKAACDALRAEIGESSLFKSGAICFCRPDIQKLIEGHTLDRINDERGVPTTTLLAFCGSPSLSSKIQQAKIKNDISAVITGNGPHHQMEFVSESYGASKSNNKARYAVDGAEDGESGSRLLLSKRRTSIYGPMKGRGTIIGPNGDDTRLLAYSFEEGLDAYCEVIQASTSSQST